MVIFGAGVLTGGLLVHQTGGGRKPRPARPAHGGTNAVAPKVTPAQMQRMDFIIRAGRELELTAEQRERIERIIREGQDRSRQIWETVAPEMRKELQLVRERIKAELTPEQRRRFEELMKRPGRPVRPDGAPAPDRLRPGNIDGKEPVFPPRQPRREPIPPVEPQPAEPR